MTGAHPALARFLEARSAVAGRASLALPDRDEGARGAAISAFLADCLDAAVAELAHGADGVAVVAVGGYGRGELARHSDVDLMLLVPEGSPKETEERAVRMLYPLWDAQLKVGHSLRTPAESVEAAKANIETYTALLDARLVAGDLDSYQAFIDARERLVRGTASWLRAQLVALRERRVHAEPWQLLAVDVKNSRGGLRGLHTLHWLDAARAIAHGHEVEPLAPALLEAHETLTLTRHAVHALVDRPNDVYRPEYAREVADWLGVDSFEWGRQLYRHMRVVDAAVATALAPEERPKRRWWRRGGSEESQSEAARPDGPDDRSQLAALRRTLDHLEPGGLLEPLGEPSWLAALLPEWEALRARPHIAPFHIHPVDVHVARTVAEARHVIAEDEFNAGTPGVAAEFGRPEEVLLAALLHDIGKGHAGVEHPAAGAVIAERFASRAGLGATATQRLVAAVRHHLLLPAVATRRDIADPEVIRETAEIVGDLDTLRLLYVLSVADARASGPNVWNQWKAQLMRALFDRVSAVLDQRPHALSVEAVAEALTGRFPPDVVRAHLAGLDATYLLSTPPERIGDQIALIEEAARSETKSAARRETLGEIDRVTLVSPDRTGLLQDIAGTLAGFNASMLGGVAYTRADGIAIQVWHVGDALDRDGRGGGIDDRRWARILEALPRAAAGAFDVEERLAEVRRSYPQPPRRADIETKVHVDNDASRDYSVLEVSAPDRRGLLYAVTKALHDLRIDIHLAKVDTIGPEVFDAFYVRRENGSRIEEPDEIERLEARIEAVLAELD
ncbi:MAG: HD domain-containing protein [Dehalococcoidia bacterium]|nr:HD domain-containing protein [Dehalococcoidia bacterium]